MSLRPIYNCVNVVVIVKIDESQYNTRRISDDMNLIHEFDHVIDEFLQLRSFTITFTQW